jgi:hypothetical protein
MVGPPPRKKSCMVPRHKRMSIEFKTDKVLERCLTTWATWSNTKQNRQPDLHDVSISSNRRVNIIKSEQT